MSYFSRSPDPGAKTESPNQISLKSNMCHFLHLHGSIVLVLEQYFYVLWGLIDAVQVQVNLKSPGKKIMIIHAQDSRTKQ